MIRSIVFAIIAIATASAHAQIEIPQLTPLGKDLTAKVATSPGDRLVWMADEGSSVIKCGDGRAHVWATPGTHKLTAILIPPGDAEPVMLSASYSVEKAGPGPTVKTLKELAEGYAATLAEMVGTLSQRLDNFTTADQVDRYFDVAASFANIPVDQPAFVEIKRRAAIAAGGKTLDAKSRESLSAALAAMAAELGGAPPVPPGPTPPPVVEGKRAIVFVTEADDASSWFANLKVQLVNDSEAARWIRTQGHAVQFLEEEQLGQDGKPLPLVESLKKEGIGVPAVFIVDPATKAVLYKIKIDPNTTPDNIVEFTKRGGG